MKTDLSRKLLGTAAAFGLTFAMACATTETDEMAPVSPSDNVAVGQTTDPLGPPQHIASRPITDQHPSSNTGAGNHSSAGSNTNLNRPAPRPVVTESNAVITQTPIVEERVVTETETVVIEDEEPVRTAQVTPKRERTTTTTTVEEPEVEVRRVTRKE